nr:ATP-binding cassette domain-containing protein [uncultured Rhodopila sp.]
MGRWFESTRARQTFLVISAESHFVSFRFGAIVWRGSVRLDSDDVTAWRTDKRVRRGLAYMSEIGIFPRLSIDENLRAGGQFIEKSALKNRMEELYADFPDLAHRRGAPAGSLSGGQRKMLGIARRWPLPPGCW